MRFTIHMDLKSRPLLREKLNEIKTLLRKNFNSETLAYIIYDYKKLKEENTRLRQVNSYLETKIEFQKRN